MIRLNRVDWVATRNTLLEAARLLDSPGISQTGKWAYIKLLRSTGDPADAERAAKLTDELMDGRANMPAWRLVESYCATDPCDPNSSRPENIDQTMTEYAAYNVGSFRLGTWSTKEDHFFTMVRPALARFEPTLAIRKHRDFIADVHDRVGVHRRQAVFELRRHNSLLSREDSLKLVNRESRAGEFKDEQAGWSLSQSCAILAFPQLSAGEQIELLVRQYTEHGFYVRLFDVMKPIDTPTFESLLRTAFEENDERRQFVILSFGAQSQLKLSQAARRHIVDLVGSPSRLVRIAALNLVARIDDPQLTRDVAQTGWTGEHLGPDEPFEAWFGSEVMANAAKGGIIDSDDALARMSLSFYGPSAMILPRDGVRKIADRVLDAVKRVSGLAIADTPPEIEISLTETHLTEPALFSLEPRTSVPNDPVERLKALAGDGEAFEENQKQAREGFRTFSKTLTNARVGLILQRIAIDEFDVLVESDRSIAEQLFGLFLQMPKERLTLALHVGHLLAHSLAKEDPEKASKLLEALNDVPPSVRYTSGRAKIPLDSMVVWSAENHPVIDQWRTRRLDQASNDYLLSLEVLAALWNNKDEFLREYIDDAIAAREPARVARALMVAGFSRRTEYASKLLSGHQSLSGFVGSACKAALFAYERNSWAEHWFTLMRKTEDPEEFWRYSTLFSKIVDGRFEVWDTEGEEASGVFRLYWPSVLEGLNSRLDKWKQHRSTKLFGDTLPLPVFLQLADKGNLL